MMSAEALRDKIAAALGDGLFVKGCYSEYGPNDDSPEWERVDGHINLRLLADVLIRELGLRRQQVDDESRYVTDWFGPADE